MCRPCPGRVIATTGTETDFQAFFVVSGIRCTSHLQDTTGTYPDFQDATGIRSDFHVFLDNFLDTMCRQCLGRNRTAAGMQPDFQTFLGHIQDASGPWQGQSLIFKHFWGDFGYGVVTPPN
ncbi:Hypothetical predicted protein [Olea europaea subsp. europaea]|uniref:Uncharacterized protein n=1 Tax=Olea europaea subsp. europaea TaxID=158383 RepID=A0A8S0PUU7_OLEEU|nr:Hypothetical predicted protein [Olea europaea subsp. europaea]